MRAFAGLADTVDWRVYFVTDTALSDGLSRVPEIVRAAVLGGAGVVQIRDKEIDDSTFLQLAKNCQVANEQAFEVSGRRACLIVNDRLEVAAELGLHFHQGQGDGDIRLARARLGQELLIGLSVSTLAELESELTEPTADVLGLSPIWATPTKTDTAPALGLAGAQSFVSRTAGQAKCVAIGGINQTNATQVIGTGVDGICVVSAIASALDPEAATRKLLASWSS